jgi:major membrane immunogen (membrane-anchored lipoprotein)
MRKLEEVENQIRNLSSPELAEFRKWYAEFDAQAWDRQFEVDVKAGKLDALADAARKAHKDGKSTKL